MIKNFKKRASFFLSTLIREHAKLALIVFLTLSFIIILFLYTNPLSQEIDHAPVQFLPNRLGNWYGVKKPTGIQFKNNQFNSSLYKDDFSPIKIHLISYQRRNEKYNQIHYPEDCLRSIGINNFQEKIVPVVINDKIYKFKRIFGKNAARAIVQYYIIFTTSGDDFLYKQGKLDLKKTIARKFSVNRARDQIFRLTVELDAPQKNKVRLADQKMIEFIKSIPIEFWPK